MARPARPKHNLELPTPCQLAVTERLLSCRGTLRTMKPQLTSATSIALPRTAATGLRALLLGGLLALSTTVTRACGMPVPFGNGDPFVSGPALTAGIVAATPCYMVGWMAGLPFKKADEVGAYSAALPYLAASGAVGAPLWGVKKVFYDGPKAIAQNLSKPKDKPAGEKTSANSNSEQ